MGNRCIIQPDGGSIGIYLHWNGGIDSVTAFLTYCRMRGFRAFGGDHMDSYGFARLTQVIANFFGGDLSIGIEECGAFTSDEQAAAWVLDNGVYVVGGESGWDIIARYDPSKGREGHNIEEMLIEIDTAQPVADRLGEDTIREKYRQMQNKSQK